MNKWQDLCRQPKEASTIDLPSLLHHQNPSESKSKHETTPYRMDLPNDIDSCHRQTKSDNCNGLPPSPACLHCGITSKFFPNHLSTRNSQEFRVKPRDASHVDKVFTKFNTIKDVPVSNDSLEQLKSLSFNNWDFDEADLLVFLQSMFSELSLLKVFKIEVTTLQKWLMKVYQCYNDVPFHNFKHCFCVTQMTYALIHLMKLQSKLSQLDISILLFSACCHDLDHPGLNNTFQVNSISRLSIIYNDSSPLENHHCSTAFKILLDDHVNIVKNLDHKDFIAFRKGVIKCILATDMAKHDSIISEFTKVLNVFEYADPNHKSLLMMVIIKVADISNEMRNIKCSTLWMECLFREYFNQSDVERENGLPVTPFMDRSRVNKTESQVNFIKTFLLPSLKFLSKLDGKLEEVIAVVGRNLMYYQMQAPKPAE